MDVALDGLLPDHDAGRVHCEALRARTVAFDSKGKELRREEVVRIERRVIDDARFAIPAGYTELKERPR